MLPDDIPDHIKAIVDNATGRAHSNGGAVMSSLALALTAWNTVLSQRIREQYANHPDVDVASWIADYVEAGAPKR